MLRSEGLLGNAVEFAARLEGMRRHSPKEAEGFRQIGTTRSHLEAVLREFSISFDESLLESLEREFVTPEAQGAVRIPGMPELVLELAGRVRIGVASNTRSHLLTQAIIAQLGLTEAVDPLVTSVSAGFRKPARQVFDSVTRLWNVPPSEIVMIGDSRRKDVDAAQDAGMRGVWLRAEPLASGIQPEALPEDFRPDGVADDAAGLRECLVALGLPS